MSVKIEWYDEEFAEKLEKKINQKLNKAAQIVEDNAKLMLSSGRRGSVGTWAMEYGQGTPPHVDTGQLRASVFWTETYKFTRIIGTMLPYGLYKEIGAWIRPSKGKYIAIPISQKAKQWSRQGNSAKDFRIGNKKLQKRATSADGPTILLVENIGGKHARTVIHYILTTGAVQYPRPWLRPALYMSGREIQKVFDEP